MFYRSGVNSGPGRAERGNLLSGIVTALDGDVTSGMSTKPGTMLLTGLSTQLQ